MTVPRILAGLLAAVLVTLVICGFFKIAGLTRWEALGVLAVTAAGIAFGVSVVALLSFAFTGGLS